MLCRSARIKLGIEELKKERNSRVKEEVLNYWYEFVKKEQTSRDTIQSVQILHRHHILCQNFYTMRKLAQVREQAILSLNKIRRVRLTSLGVAQLRL